MFFDLTFNAGWKLLGWLLVFVGLVSMNEVARRTKIGGIVWFLGIPGALTLYFLVFNIAALFKAPWALNNWTIKYMGSWFHYAKLYAATIGCIGFMMIKYEWGIGKEKWFRPFPFIIVAINILIAVASDFESGIKGYLAMKQSGDATYRWWLSNEGVFLYGGWWNWVNGIAGIINIACMTGWWGIYHSKKNRADMLWPDMTFVYIIAYDIWNFAYTYNNLPTHSWYCGLALLLAPTFANAFWNKGGWIQNRANTLAIWCMFAQVFPLFQDFSRFTTYSSVYPKGTTYVDMQAAAAAEVWTKGLGDGGMAQGLISALALVVNVVALTAIIVRSLKQHKNPYTNEIFTDQKDFQEAMARAEVAEA